MTTDPDNPVAAFARSVRADLGSEPRDWLETAAELGQLGGLAVGCYLFGLLDGANQAGGVGFRDLPAVDPLMWGLLALSVAAVCVEAAVRAAETFR